MVREAECDDIGSMARAIRTGRLTVRDLIEATLDRISRERQSRAAFVAVRDDLRAAADDADREIAAGRWRGPLHGVPIALKDNIDYAAMATGAGMPGRAGMVATRSATVARRLEDAGAIIVGKLGMAEGASMMHHPSIAAPRNPWGDTIWPGASSSGAGAAVAAGLCLAAIGTDTGGSIRMPAAACGVTGLMPTWGRVSRDGVLPLAESFDHVGPLARSAADAALILAAIAGRDPRDPTSLAAPVPDYIAALDGGIARMRIGHDPGLSAALDPEVGAAHDRALALFAALGATIVPTALPPPDAIGEIAPLLRRQIALVHGAAPAADRASFSRHFADVIESGERADGAQVARAMIAHDAYTGALRAAIAPVDVLLTPTLPGLPPYLDAIDALGGDIDAMLGLFTPLTFPANIARLPAISFPAGLSADGRPIGLQLIGHPLDEAGLLRATHAFQTHSDHHRRRPPTHPL